METEASPYKGGRTNKSPHMQAYALTHSDTTRSLYFIVILLQCRLLIQSFYEGMLARVQYDGAISDSFPIN